MLNIITSGNEVPSPSCVAPAMEKILRKVKKSNELAESQSHHIHFGNMCASYSEHNGKIHSEFFGDLGFPNATSTSVLFRNIGVTKNLTSIKPNNFNLAGSNFYKCDDLASVIAFLSENGELANILVELENYLNDGTGSSVNSAEITHSFDIEMNLDAIIVRLELAEADVEEALELEDKVIDEFLYPKKSIINGKLVVKAC